MKIPILMYHSISDDNSYLSVTKNNFERHLKILKFLGYETIVDFKNTNNPKKIMITFDDGYKDLIKNALPILKRYGFKSVCFIVTDYIGKFNTWDLKKNNFIKKKLMNKNDIKKWLKSGMTIGSHSTSHIDLKSVKNNKLLRKLILQSQKRLNKLFKKKINFFSYPYGKYTDASINLIQKKYKFAFSTMRGRYDRKKHNPYLIPRISIKNSDSFIAICFKLFTIYEDIKYKK